MHSRKSCVNMLGLLMYDVFYLQHTMKRSEKDSQTKHVSCHLVAAQLVTS